MKGFVKWVNPEKKFGFVVEENTKKDFFFAFYENKDCERFKIGDAVNFEIVSDNKGGRVNNLIKVEYEHKEEIYEKRLEGKTIISTICEINDEIKKFLAKNPEKLYELSPRKFEELIAEILNDFGFDVQLTQATRDGGKDIYAYIRNQVSSFLMFVECKKYSPENRVGIEVVQRLYGVQQVNKANKSMVVTTSFFSKPAVEESRRYENLMDLADYTALKGWLERYF